MIKVIEKPVIIKAAGNKEKRIEEYFGRISSATTEVSIARMISQEGWEEPGQCPEFNEYTVVLKGKLKVETSNEEFTLGAGQAIMTDAGEWVRYSTPFPGGAEYIAVCLPAFSPEIVNRDK